MNENQSSAPFPGKNIYLGGIYPFKPDGLVISPESNNLPTNTPSLTNLKNYRSRIYFSEQGLSFPLKSYELSISRLSLTLTTGKTLANLELKAYISIYEETFATIVFWVSLEGYNFQLNELVEIIALTRNTNERVKVNQSCLITIQEDNYQFYNNFLEICQLVLKPKIVARHGTEKPDSKIELLYPMLFVGEMPCDSKEEILQKYSQEITALAEVWISNTVDIHESEIERVKKTEFHPFNFGLSVITAGCTVELHPRINQEDFSASLAELLATERLVLSTICELPIAKYYLLRLYDRRLSTEDLNIIPSNGLLYWVFPIYLIVRALQLTIIRSSLLRGLYLFFQSVYITRKSYTKVAFERYSSIFNLSLLEESIDKKIQSLNDSIRTIYSMLLSLFGLILSLLGLGLALIKFVLK